MTTVYKVGYQLDRVTAFALVDQARQGFFNQFDGRALSPEWVPPPVQPADTRDDDATFADCTVLGTVPLLSRRATDALQPLLEGSVEFLAVRYSRAVRFILNVLGTADCLVEAESQLERFPTGRVMRIHRYSFDASRLPRSAILRLPQIPRGHLFVTDKFVSEVQEAALSGFAFDPVWTSSAGG